MGDDMVIYILLVGVGVFRQGRSMGDDMVIYILLVGVGVFRQGSSMGDDMVLYILLVGVGVSRQGSSMGDDMVLYILQVLDYANQIHQILCHPHHSPHQLRAHLHYQQFPAGRGGGCGYPLGSVWAPVLVQVSALGHLLFQPSTSALQLEVLRTSL